MSTDSGKGLDDLYSDLESNARDAIVVCVGTKRVFVNSAYLRLHDIKSMELALSMEAEAFVVADDLPKIEARNRAGAPLTGFYEYRIRLPNGHVKTLEACTVGIFWNGRPASLELLRDITVARGAGLSLSTLANVVASSSDAIIDTNIDGIITHWNKGAEQIYGYSAPEMIGQSIFRLRPDSEQRKDESEVTQALMKGQKVDLPETIRIARNGKVRNVLVSLSPIVGQGGQIIGVSGIHHDVTNRKSQEQDISQLVSLLDSTDDAVFITTVDGVIESWNKGAEKMYGYTAEEVLGEPISVLIALGHKWHTAESISDLKDKQRSHQMTSMHIRKNGQTFPISYTVAPLANGAGTITQLAVSERDTSDIVLLETQLRQAQKMEAVGRLAGGIAHDFNNFLTPIIGFAEMGAREARADDPSQQRFHQIIRAAYAAAGLTKQLLSFSRKQRWEDRVIQINELLAQMQSLLKGIVGDNIKLQISSPLDAWSIKADPVAIQQVLLNLVTNAKDAMPNGGNLKIDVANVVLDDAYSANRVEVKPGDYIVVTITDTGAGMTPEVMSHVFEPFYTTKEKGKGTGLGLATSYGIVKQAGGEIIIATEPNVGTAVTLYFPRTHEDAMKAFARQVVNHHGNNKTILLVDDNAAVRETIEQMLHRLGYHVLKSSDGVEALRLLAQPATLIDVLLTDVVMPGVSGVELARKVRQIRPRAKILLMTGYMDRDLDNKDLKSELAQLEVLAKPFSMDQLAEMLEKVGRA